MSYTSYILYIISQWSQTKVFSSVIWFLWTISTYKYKMFTYKKYLSGVLDHPSSHLFSTPHGNLEMDLCWYMQLWFAHFSCCIVWPTYGFIQGFPTFGFSPEKPGPPQSELGIHRQLPSKESATHQEHWPHKWAQSFDRPLLWAPSSVLEGHSLASGCTPSTVGRE